MDSVFGLPEDVETLLRARTHTVCFTGHRKLPPDKIPGIRRDLERTVRSLLDAGYLLFLTGGALGFDTLALEVLLSLKAEYPKLRTVTVIPCLSQSDIWSAEDREHYVALLSQADGCICLQREYTPDCMHRRNRFMVDTSRILIAYYDGRPRSGSGNTVRYAEENGVEIRHLHPAAWPR